jgi:hypothetical protein
MQGFVNAPEFRAVRTAALNDSLADSFSGWFPGFRPKVVELLAA